MKVQYIIGSEDLVGLGDIIQPKKNADLLIGLLDLPTGQITPFEFEFYLKSMALFYDRLIIPDGWLHCDGPVFRYLQHQYRLGKSSTSSVDFASNTFFSLLSHGIIVPLLRGKRPESVDDVPYGYNLYNVWSAEAKDNLGNTLDFGVFKSDPQSRMMILDQESEENNAILERLSGRISVFGNWEDPSKPISSPSNSPRDAVKQWDNEFSEKVYQLLLDSEIGLDLFWIDPFSKLGLLNDKQAIKSAEGFLKNMQERIKTLRYNKASIRRGTIENEFASQLKIDRLYNYEGLRSSGKGIEKLLARLVLNQVSTIQELLFAEKVKCSSGFPASYSPDVLMRLAEPSFGLLDSIDALQEGTTILSKSGVNISGLEVEQIVALRDSNKGYFSALGKMRDKGDHRNSYAKFIEAAKKYATDIAKEAPLAGVIKHIPNAASSIGLSGITGGIVASVTNAGIAIVLGGLAVPILFLAKPVLNAGKTYVQPKVNTKIEEVVKRAFQERRIDGIRMFLGANDGPRTITRGII